MNFSLKRLFVPALILVPALALAACGGSDTTPIDNSEAVKKGEALVKSNGGPPRAKRRNDSSKRS